MSVSKNMKQQGLQSTSKGSKAATARKPGKMLGTRVGVLDDWRSAGAKGTGEKSELGKRLRDGR